MVRRITRCCDSQQVGVPGLSTFSLRSAARGSWGVVFTCLLLAGRERELGDPDLAEDWIFFWGEISGVFFHTGFVLVGFLPSIFAASL